MNENNLFCFAPFKHRIYQFWREARVGRFKLFNHRKRRSRKNKSKAPDSHARFEEKPAAIKIPSATPVPYYEAPEDAFDDDIRGYDHHMSADADQIRDNPSESFEIPADIAGHEALPDDIPEYVNPAGTPEHEISDETDEVVPAATPTAVSDISPASTSDRSRSPTEMDDRYFGHAIDFKGRITCSVDGNIGGHIDIKASLSK